MNGMHHPRADVDSLCIKRKDGGWGLLVLQSLEANKIQIKYKLTTLHENKYFISQLEKYLESEKLSKIASKPLHGNIFQTFRGSSHKQRIKCEMALKNLKDSAPGLDGMKKCELN